MTDGKGGSSGVPEGWQKKTLGELPLSIIDGDRSSNYPNQEAVSSTRNITHKILFLSTANFKNNKLDLTNVQFITEKKFASLSKGKLVTEDLVITLRGSVGNLIKFDSEFETGFINAQMAILRNKNPGELNTDFLYLALCSDSYQSLLFQLSTGSAQPQLPLKDLKKLPLSLPPLEEQRKIAEILSTWDDAIEQQTRLVELRRERKRGLMQQLLTGRVRFGEFAGLEWGEVTLESVASFIGRGTAPTYVEDESVTYAVNQKCVRNGGVSIEFARAHDEHAPIKKVSTLQQHDICINSTGTGTAGRIGLWEQPKNEKYYFVDTHVTILRLQPEKANPKFVTDLLQTPQLQNRLEVECIFGGTNQVELSRTDFAKLFIRLPPLPEQQKIATVLSAADAEIDTLTVQLAALKTQKRGLMQQLLTGQTRVSVA